MFKSLHCGPGNFSILYMLCPLHLNRTAPPLIWFLATYQQYPIEFKASVIILYVVVYHNWQEVQVNLQLNGVQYHWYNRLVWPALEIHLVKCFVLLGLNSTNSWSRNSLSNNSVAVENRWIILAQNLKPGLKFYTHCIPSH